MSSNHQASALSSVTSRLKEAGSKYSYSLKRWNAFDAWQDHVRKSAATVGNAFSGRADRDLRRAIVAG
jgi:hypothetical protein